MFKSSWPQEIQNMLSEGYYLSKEGIDNWVLTKQEALRVLERMLAAQIPLLGGNVFEYHGKFFSSNYDSWHCDQRSDEEADSFLSRSILEASKYITSYPKDDVYFVLVPRF